MTDELWRLGIAEIADGVASRGFSVREVVDSLARRIEETDAGVGAWATLDLAGAARDAAALDEQLAREASSSQGEQPATAELTLCGVPFGIKDVFLTRAMATQMGSPLFEGFVPEHEAKVVAQLREAGALIAGKTATTAFAGADPAPTINPWAAGRTPGGSSSGSAAAVACGMVPAALGTQTAGSVLRPAAFCGVVGFKPTFGVLSTEGVFPFARSLDTVGIIARSAGDVARVFRALAPQHDAVESGAPGDMQDIRLRLIDAGALLADPAISEHVRAEARRLESAGAQVREAELPGLDLIVAAQNIIVHAEGTSVHLPEMIVSRHLYGPRWQAMTDLGQLIPAPAYAAALHLQRELADAVGNWLGPADLLILPTCGDQVPDLSSTGDPGLQALFTFLHMPAISLPAGRGRDGLPRGIQLVAWRGADSHLLRAAAWIQEVLGYPVVFPPAGDAWEE